MNRLMMYLGFVIVATMLGGLLGGYGGREVGRLSPSFVTGIAYPNPKYMPPSDSFRPAEFGMGLGIVSGFFFGAGTGLFLVLLTIVREIAQARFEVARLMVAGPLRKESAADRVH